MVKGQGQILAEQMLSGFVVVVWLVFLNLKFGSDLEILSIFLTKVLANI